MPFKTILSELVESTPGATGAILADWEGEAVAQYAHYDEFDLKVLGAHKGILFNMVKEVHHQFPAGKVEEVVVGTDRCRMIVGAVGADYSLVMTLVPEGLLGLARYRFRGAVALLHKEIY